MAVIRPSAELRNNYNEISRICHETQQPVYITKNGADDLVVLSNEAYEKNEDTKIQKKVEEIFNKKYLDLEAFKKELYENKPVFITENGDINFYVLKILVKEKTAAFLDQKVKNCVVSDENNF